MPRSAIIDPVTFTANRTGSTRSRWRTNSDRVLPIRSRWRFDGWPPGFKPVPVDIRSKLTARIKFNNHLGQFNVSEKMSLRYIYIKVIKIIHV